MSSALSAALCALAWLGGVALQLQQPVLWPAPVVQALCGGALLVLLGAWRWRRRGLGLALLVSAVAAFAFGSTAWRAAERLQDSLPAALEGQDLRITGVIAELPRVSAGGTRFVLDAEAATLADQPVRVPSRLSLGWYRGADDDAGLSGPDQELRAGQRWSFTLRLRQPHGTFNPHGFDFELYLFEREIGAVGSVRAKPESPPHKLADAAGYPVQRLRQSVRDAIDAQVRDPASAGVLAALAIGDQAAIDRDGWDLFRTTGLGHLMSISGLHVTMLAWLGGALIGWLWRLSPQLLLRCPAPQAARWGGLMVAFSYALMAGWGVPAQRTVWMIALVVLLRSAGLRWPLHAVLLAAALAVTLADPWALLQPGFWLSFMAVALLVASEPVHAADAADAADGAREQVVGWRPRLWAALRGGLRTQAIATVGLAPLTLVFFQQLSLVGFVANLIAIPLVTLLVTPLALLGILLPPLWLLDAAIVRALIAWLQWLATWPWAQWQAAVAPPWAMACGLLAGAVAVLPLPTRLRWLAVPLLLPLLAPAVPRPAVGQFELVAADVGQGTAVLVRTQQRLLLFDTGPLYSADADAGSRVLLPLLRARGETRIHTLVLSHRDADHVGGAAALLDALPVERIVSSLTPEHPLLARGVPHTRCDAGQPGSAWDWDGVHFQLLHPLPADHADQRKANALSCVLRVSNGHRSVLLTGDIEAAQEAALLRRHASAPSLPRGETSPPSLLRSETSPPPSLLHGETSPPSLLHSDVLLVPHHGSRTSSTAAFIDAVQPQVAVVQAAYRSRFGHPAPDVVARYTARGVAVVRSDRCGAWTWPAGDAPASHAAPADATGPALSADPDAAPAAAPVAAPAAIPTRTPTAEGRCERQLAQRYWHHRPQPELPVTP